MLSEEIEHHVEEEEKRMEGLFAQARKAGLEEAALLGIEPGDPLLTMERTAYDAEGRAVEYGRHAYPAEAYSFEMMLSDL